MSWKTIRTFTDPMEAQIVKSRLLSDGIDSVVQNEHIVNVNPFYTHAVGGLKLQVKEEDVARAERILAELNEFEDPERDS